MQTDILSKNFGALGALGGFYLRWPFTFGGSKNKHLIYIFINIDTIQI